MAICAERTVIITGAGGGLGRAYALAFAGQGANVVVNDIRREAAEEVVAEILQAGGQAIANADDITTLATAQHIVDAALAAFGEVHVLVNNAGILRDRMFISLGEDDWDAVMRVHLKGHFCLANILGKRWRDQAKAGNKVDARIINTSSGAGLQGSVGQSNYSAAKLGIMSLSKSIALDMARFHVRSNCISPFAWSRMTSSVPDDTPEKAARNARNRQMTPEKIAPLAVYLMSEQANHVNAQVFAVRNNEIFLMSQPRPIRSVHSGEGWTPDSIASHAMPALSGSFVPCQSSGEVFCWDPI